MIINHNITALNTHRQLSTNTAATSKNIEKLSSGLKINRAGDDAAGLAISEKMRGQIRGLDMASKNAQDGISMIQTAEGALSETHSILQRMRELAVQASNDTTTDSDRSEIQKEVSQLKEEIGRISNATEFNTKKLLDGSLEKSSLSQGTKLESVKLQGTNTQGTSTAKTALATSTNIATDVNDKITIAVDGGTSTEITIAQGKYDKKELVAAVNDAIGKQSALAGKVTAELDSNGKLAFISTSTGTTSNVGVTDGTAAKSAVKALGFETGATYVAQADVTNTASDVALTTEADLNKNIVLSLDSGAIGAEKTYTVTMAELGYKTGDTFGDDAADATKLQAAFDSKFGKDAVTVTSDGTKFSFSSALGTATITAGTSTSTIGAATGGTGYTGHAFDAGSKVDGATAQAIATGSTTRLVALGDSDGNNLGLKSGNQLNISAIVGGQEKKGTLEITGTTTLQELADKVRDVIGGTASVSIDSKGQLQISGQQGEASAVSNLKLSAQVSSTDSTAVGGKFSDKLSAYKETQAAKDTHTDSALTFQIGANQDQKVNVDINEMSVESLSLSSLDVSSSSGAQTAITVVENALEKVSAERSKIGAFQNRLEHTINNLNTSSENLTAAESRIRDVDMAKEMMEQTKNNILAQAAQAMLAQANQQPQGVLQLLR